MRQYSSQMHLDVFLDKVKQQREEEGEGTRAKEACLDEDAEADGVTQMIEDEGKRGASEADEMKSSEGGAEDRPPLEAPSSDLPDDYADAWDDEHIRWLRPLLLYQHPLAHCSSCPDAPGFLARHRIPIAGSALDPVVCYRGGI